MFNMSIRKTIKEVEILLLFLYCNANVCMLEYFLHQKIKLMCCIEVKERECSIDKNKILIKKKGINKHERKRNNYI